MRVYVVDGLLLMFAFELCLVWFCVLFMRGSFRFSAVSTLWVTCVLMWGIMVSGWG